MYKHKIKVRLKQPLKTWDGDIMAYNFENITADTLFAIFFALRDKNVVEFRDETNWIFLPTDMIAAVEITENED